MNTPELAAIKTNCIICGVPVPPERMKSKSITCSEEHAKARKARLRRGDASCLCVVCTTPVPVDRLRFRPITCSPEHGVLRKASIRARVDQRRCRVCQKPSSPIERAAYKRFRSIELMRPDLLYPAAFKRYQQETGGDVQMFSQALIESLEAKEAAGDDSPGRFDLQLIDRRSKDSPNGTRGGRPRIQWQGGDPDCIHATRVQRKGAKEIPMAQRDQCRKCEAVRVGGVK